VTVVPTAAATTDGGLDAGQWAVIGDLLAERGLIGLVDIAYLGLADGIEPDRAFLTPLAERGTDLLICSSFSKNMGLYRERVGGLTIVAPDAAVAEAVQSNIKVTVRAIYSNPPSLGGAIVANVLDDPVLRTQWLDELAVLRGCVNAAVTAAGLESRWHRRQRHVLSPPPRPPRSSVCATAWHLPVGSAGPTSPRRHRHHPRVDASPQSGGPPPAPRRPAHPKPFGRQPTRPRRHDQHTVTPSPSCVNRHAGWMTATHARTRRRHLDRFLRQPSRPVRHDRRTKGSLAADLNESRRGVRAG
jgi:hypothetical protein